MEDYLILFRNLLIALALGFLIGLERGWSKRELEPGRRIAGIRTFGLIALLGALTMLLARESSLWVITLAFAGLGVLIAAVTYVEAQKTGEYGITTEVAAFIAFVLGALTMTPHVKLAAAAAVITTIVLGTKPVLHAWIRRLSPEELQAVFKLLLISVVLLPILPNRTFDPWNALNPYEIWWMVVLISAISFLGYFAIKIAGPGRGVLLTGLLGGLVSSTAVTLNLSRLARLQPGSERLLAGGIVIASTTMFVRILIVTLLLRPLLTEYLAAPLLAMTAAGYLGTWQLVRRRDGQAAVSGAQSGLRNPFELDTALGFGLFLAFILWLTQVLRQWIGEAGVYLTAVLSGLTDVDAITLSLTRLAEDPALLAVAVRGILLAAVVNTLVKGGMAAVIGGWRLGTAVGGVFLGQIAVGIAILLWQEWAYN
ncbi:hypothetical protein MIT9_P0621 [Methylomarinovum caldicuralii]|uniref:DUF4010 domain-containing protein n=1 Tax=Methylomarinovum caldicuralii TaxID=438856 RepID=A0AAU9C0H4_9GAMM|nr:MgtC/SapB family protein [Methylomarinovum caldicuralii]BCX81043.1 hypothetical protein MIT9_P0621 [Methylomarinovum caldicuralii]